MAANAGAATRATAVLHHRGTPQPALNGGYTIFGLCDNTALVGTIARVEKAPGEQPIKDVVMKKVTIQRAAKADKAAKPPKAEEAEGPVNPEVGPGGVSAGLISRTVLDVVIHIPRRESAQHVKHFVLDTNILLHDPRAITQFADNEVVIPIFVIEEIDQFKKEASGARAQRAWRSRACSTACAPRERGCPTARPCLTAGGCASPRRCAPMPTTLRESQIADYLILMVALDVRDANKGEPTVFVTKDVNLRIRADSLGLTSMDFEAEKIDIDELYSRGSSTSRHPAPTSTRSTRRTRSTSPRATSSRTSTSCCAIARTRRTALLRRFDGATKKVVPLRKIKEGIWGIRPHNKEQHCALDLLLNDEIKLTSRSSARAAPGRRCLPLLLACRRSSRSSSTKLLVSRPIFPAGPRRRLPPPGRSKRS